jgi:hypothetical protein
MTHEQNPNPPAELDWGKVKAFAGLMTNDLGAAM